MANAKKYLDLSGLTTYDSSIKNYIEEVTPDVTILTGSLAANQETLTFTNNKISTNTRIEVFASVYGLCALNMSVSEHTLTLTFPSAHSAATINVHCWN